MNKLVKEPSYNLIPERDLGKTPILECRRIGSCLRIFFDPSSYPPSLVFCIIDAD